MEVNPNAELPVFSDAMKRFGKEKRRSIRRVTISAVVDEERSRLPVAEGNAGLNKLGRLAIDPWKRGIARLDRIQHDKCSVYPKSGFELLRQRYGMIADAASRRF
jgi:hypothetical protein